MGLTLLANASMPLKYWGEAFLTATYLINRLLTPLLQNKSPLETLFNQTPSYHDHKTFGCACYPFLRPYNQYKIEFGYEQCVFLGYRQNQKGYLCLASTGKIYVTRHVQVDESLFPFFTNAHFASPPLSYSTAQSPSICYTCNFCYSLCYLF